MQHFSGIVEHDQFKDMIKKGASKHEQEQKLCESRAQILSQFLQAAFQQYCSSNSGKRPELIIIYRDGIGGPTFQDKVLQLEGPSGALQAAIQGFAQNYKPKILYIFVNKKITTRIFEKVNGEVINPGPGTLADTGIVEEDGDKTFDFYLIANDNPKTATALPVHYQVAMNTSGLTKEEIEELTYQQCYSYFGFGGPIKVPASVKYAEKLANYANDTKAQPNVKLSNRLHFL